MNATADEQMTAGSQVTIAVSLGGGQIYNQNIDMAKGTKLPVSQGVPFIFKYGVDIPSIAPSGDYGVQLTFMDQTTTPLLCVQVNFSLMPADEVEDAIYDEIADEPAKKPRKIILHE